MGVSLSSWEDFERAAIDRAKQADFPVETLVFAGFRNLQFDLDETFLEAFIHNLEDYVDLFFDTESRDGAMSFQEIQKTDRSIFVPHGVQGLVSEVESRIEEFYSGLMVGMVHTPFLTPPASMQAAYRPWYRAMISIGRCSENKSTPYLGNIEFILLFNDSTIINQDGKQSVKAKIGIAAQLPVIAAMHASSFNPNQQRAFSEHFVSQTDNALRYLWSKLDEVSELESGVCIAFKPSSGNVQGKSENAVYLANRAYRTVFKGKYNFNPSAEIRTGELDMQTKPKSAQAPRGSILINYLNNYIAQSGKKTII